MEPVLFVPNICLPLERTSSKLKIQPKGEILPGPPVQIPWVRKTACISNLLIKESVHFPYQLDTNDMKLWLNAGYTPDMWLKYAKDTFETLYREGEQTPKMMSLGVHLRIIGRPGRIWALEQFFEHISKFDRIWVTTREKIAEHLR